jgi:hypothetical protein
MNTPADRLKPGGKAKNSLPKMVASTTGKTKTAKLIHFHFARNCL